MPVPQHILDLVERFDRNRDAYRSGRYNETQIRREFIDPFFGPDGPDALGWDVGNRRGYAEAYKDVIHEDAIRVGSATKAPDYCFRIGGTRKFFVEAKKPSVDIRDDVHPAYQLRRYAWSAKLPLSILTDFEEFAVYDCRVRPNRNDKASTARIMYVEYGQYADRWDEIAGIFSRDAILKGSFDKYAESGKRKRGTAEVDEVFLAEIEAWREVLARNFALRNSDLSRRDLNFAVQRTIDRIIFLRMCEDRGIEQHGQLRALHNGPEIYRRMGELFRRADERYNSGLFHFAPEKGRDEPPDELTLALRLDDKPLGDILGGLYYPESPYEFSVLPPEILGQVYEQFLGKVIRLTAGHQARIEEKPEVKKAGGVYYTPAYIVDYIVRQTVGKLVEGKTPREIGGLTERFRPSTSRHPLTVLDPACGSGSFLLGAYQYLLDWYRDRYIDDGPDAHARANPPRLYQAGANDWRLTTAERKRILLSHIYGVDIDAQAVEVTKLSLLLKVLEGETGQRLDNQLRLFHERALPDLGRNIKCGNSLIGPDFYDNQQMELFDEEQTYRINAFDWHAEFPDIFKQGGFDAVIGNPPYVLLQDEFRDDVQLAYFRPHFEVASYKLDTYHLFMEKGIRLTASKGRCAMITPANFLTNNYLSGLRRFILEQCTVDHILAITGGVFRGVSVDNAIIVTAGRAPTQEHFAIRHSTVEREGLTFASEVRISPARSLSDKHVLFTGAAGNGMGSIWQKILEASEQLGALAHVNFGKQLRDRRQHTDDVIALPHAGDVPCGYRPCYTGKDISRYYLAWGNLACLDDEVARCGGCWDASKQNAVNKLLTRQIGRYPVFALDALGHQCLNTIFMVNLRSQGVAPRYLLGVLNSRLMRALWLDRFYDQRRTFPKIKGTYLKQLPIRSIDSADKEEVARHDRIVKLVDRMLTLHEHLAAARTGQDKEVLQRQIDATDRQIDALVYELYGLSEDEIKIVEEATAR